MSAVDMLRSGQDTETRLPLTRLARLWTAGTGIALLLVTLMYLVAQGLAEPLVVAGAGEVTLAQVAAFTVLGATGAGALAAAIGRFSRRPRLTFLAATLIALAGYAVVPIAAAQSVATAIWLNLFQVAVAVPVIGMLFRWLPGDRTPLEA